MAAKLQFTCDICGTERKDTNHWFEFYDDPLTGSIGVRPFEGNDHLIQVCGQKCAHAMLDRWLSTGSLEKQGD